MIRNLIVAEDEFFATGFFDSKSLFQGEMEVNIFVSDGATENDAEKCIAHYNSLVDKKEICDAIDKGLEKFFLYMFEEWECMEDIYSDIAKSLIPIMDGYKAGKKLLSYLYNPSLVVYAQQNEELGYSIESECPWEPEHMCLILIRNDDVVYVGPSGGQEPWDDEDELYCIWNDEE
ncbi:MAG: hypothetical protein K6G64_11025 [Eubacterium sp.]|nr:hypothetical protein [Eubacterium sp.]